jgi:hypothetical protein
MCFSYRTIARPVAPQNLISAYETSCFIFIFTLIIQLSLDKSWAEESLQYACSWLRFSHHAKSNITTPIHLDLFYRGWILNQSNGFKLGNFVYFKHTSDKVQRKVLLCSLILRLPTDLSHVGFLAIDRAITYIIPSDAFYVILTISTINRKTLSHRSI